MHYLAVCLRTEVYKKPSMIHQSLFCTLLYAVEQWAVQFVLPPDDPSWDNMLRLTLPHKAGQCLIARTGLSRGRPPRWYQGPHGERMQLECVHGGRSSQRRLLSAYQGCFFAARWREGPKLWQGSCNGYSCVSCFLCCHWQGLPFTSSPSSIIRWISNYTAQEAGYLDWAIECGSSR